MKTNLLKSSSPAILPPEPVLLRDPDSFTDFIELVGLPLVFVVEVLKVESAFDDCQEEITLECTEKQDDRGEPHPFDECLELECLLLRVKVPVEVGPGIKEKVSETEDESECLYDDVGNEERRRNCDDPVEKQKYLKPIV